jgi:DNA-binding CsgD family transcriptional regulator
MKKHSKAKPISGLSPRQQQVLRLVVDGSTSREIASVLGVTPSSIHTYRSRIMAKLEVSNIASLVRLAIRHGVIRP